MFNLRKFERRALSAVEGCMLKETFIVLGLILGLITVFVIAVQSLRAFQKWMGFPSEWMFLGGAFVILIGICLIAAASLNENEARNARRAAMRLENQ